MRVDAVSDDGTGGGSGTACFLGVMDSYRSVWSPKAFSKPILSRFTTEGFISDSHMWEKHLATIDSAKVSRNELNIAWTWYSTGDAQEMRTKCKERIERGKVVGLSIGAIPDWAECQDFDSGEKLWNYAETVMKDDMSLYDPASRKHKGFCWVSGAVRRLVETGITLVPAVPNSMQKEARSLDDLLSGEPLGGLPFGEHLERVLGALVGVEGRALEIEELRAGKGERIGRDNLGRIVALRDSLTSLIERSGNPQPDAATRAVENYLAARRIPALRG